MFKKIIFFFLIGFIALSAEAQQLQQPSTMYSKSELIDVLDSGGQITIPTDWYKDVTPAQNSLAKYIKPPKKLAIDTLFDVVALRVSAGSQSPSDWNATSGVTRILNKPNLFSGNYVDLTNKPTLFSGNYVDLTNKPTLFSGSYLDLTNKPIIPSAQVNSDWSAVSGLSQIINKPTLFSGNYVDLTNKPTIPAAQVNSDWNAASGLSQILNKPTLFSGNYVDLTNKPTIPAAQVNSDWNAVSGLSQILNRPTIPTYTAGAGIDITGSTIANTGDISNTNEIQNLSIVGSNLSISGGNTVALPASTDAQTLSIVGSDLSISGGNTVTLPSGGGASNVQVLTTSTVFTTTNDANGDELTAFNYNCLAGKIYKFEYQFSFTTAAATTGIKVWSQPFDGTNRTQGYFQASLSSTAVATELKQPIPGGQPFITTGLSLGSTGILKVEFVFVCNTNTTKTIRLGTEVFGSAVQYQPFSSLVVTTLN